MSLPSRLVWSAWTVVAALLLSSALGSSGWLRGGDPLLALCASALAVELWLAAAAIACALLFADAPRQTLGLVRGRLSWGQVGLLALGTLGASHALDGVLDWTRLSDESVLGYLTGLLEGAQGARLGVALVALGAVPGLAEELLCRGLVQRSLARRLGAGLAIPAAALVFGMLHVEPIHAGFAALLGLYLGLVAYWADSTYPAMLCHVANNVAAVLLGAQLGDLAWSPWISIVAGSALAAVCLWGVARGRAGQSAPPQPVLGRAEAAGSADPPGPESSRLQRDVRPSDR